MQPTKWIHYYSWLVACRYKTHGSNDKSQKFTRRLFPLSPDDVLRVTTLAFSSISKAQSKSSEQFTGKKARQSRAEGKVLYGIFFCTICRLIHPCRIFYFSLKNCHQMLRMCKASADIWYEIFQKPTFTANDIAVVYGTLHCRLSATVIVMLRQGNLGFYGSD